MTGHGMDEMKGKRGGQGRGACHPTPKHSLSTHSPSVQFLESSSVPLQSRPPFWGGGAMHSRLRQCAHSVLQADHLLHSVHAPSTAGAQHRHGHAITHSSGDTETKTYTHAHTHARTHTRPYVCTYVHAHGPTHAHANHIRTAHGLGAS